MSKKLPKGVVLEMEEGIVLMPCVNCYFVKVKKCPTEWANGGFVRSCTNGRNVIFKELGVEDDRAKQS